jgi:Tfp pilus assembly protein PilF
MLSVDLAGTDQLRVAASETVARMVHDLVLPQDDMPSPDTLGRIRRYGGGSDYVITGAYLTMADGDDSPVRVDVRVQKIDSGESVLVLTESGRHAQLLELVGRLGARVKAGLGLPSASTAETSLLAAAPPANVQVVRLYTDGLAKLRAQEATTAKELFEAAIAIDRNYQPAYSALSEAWRQLADGERARSAARRAVELSAGLSTEDRLLAEARYADATRDLPNRLRLYRSLFELRPDEMEYGLKLATVQFQAEQRDAGSTTLNGLAQWPSPFGDDPRILLTRARFERDAGRVLELARQAKVRAERRGLKYLAASAAQDEARALKEVGDRAGVAAAREYARAIFSESGDRLELAYLLNATAGDMNGAWKLADAQRDCEQARELFSELRDDNGRYLALSECASVYRRQGHLAAAGQAYEEMGAILPRQRPGALTSGERLSWRSPQLWLAYDHGDVVAATKEFGSLVDKLDPLPRSALVCIILLRERGEIAKAQSLLEASLAKMRKDGSGPALAWPLRLLAGLHYVQDDLPAARRALDEMIAVRQKGDTPDGKEDLALVLLEQGEVAQALEVARNTAEFFRQMGAPDYEMSALGVVVRALLAQERIEPALEAAERLRQLAQSSENVPRRARARIEASRGYASAGDFATARQLLTEAKSDAQRGYLEVLLEERLASAEVVKEQDPAATLKVLRALSRDAERAGFRHIAGRARRIAENFH